MWGGRALILIIYSIIFILQDGPYGMLLAIIEASIVVFTADSMSQGPVVIVRALV